MANQKYQVSRQPGWAHLQRATALLASADSDLDPTEYLHIDPECDVEFYVALLGLRLLAKKSPTAFYSLVALYAMDPRRDLSEEDEEDVRRAGRKARKLIATEVEPSLPEDILGNLHRTLSYRVAPVSAVEPGTCIEPPRRASMPDEPPEAGGMGPEDWEEEEEAHG